MLHLSKKVLVLNGDYRAFSVCSVYKAFVLVYLQKAEIVAEMPKAALRTVSSTFPVPSIIRLRGYVNVPYKGVMLNRQNIFRRDGNRCVYCQSKDNLTLDHVLPRSRGGQSTWTNLVSACRPCNTKKGDFLPEEANMPLPYKPYKPSFVMFLREFSNIGDESWYPYLES